MIVWIFCYTYMCHIFMFPTFTFLIFLTLSADAGVFLNSSMLKLMFLTLLSLSFCSLPSFFIRTMACNFTANKDASSEFSRILLKLWENKISDLLLECTLGRVEKLAMSENQCSLVLKSFFLINKQIWLEIWLFDRVWF